MTIVTREDIIETLTAALTPLDYVHAMWEAGAAAFNRIDQWSDLDLQVDVDDERVEDALEVIESALWELSGVELKYRLPEPTPHGHAQVFYRLRDASRFHLVDLVVMKHSDQNKFLEREIHGEPAVMFDKSGVVRYPPFDRDAFAAKLRERLGRMRVTFDMFQAFVLKEVHRGNDVEALVYYQASTLRPLLEALSIKYRPERHNFYTRYIYYEFPPEVVRKLEELFFVVSADDLVRKREEAERWFYAILDEMGDVPRLRVGSEEER